jgi:hypothetical protein
MSPNGIDKNDVLINDINRRVGNTRIKVNTQKTWAIGAMVLVALSASIGRAQITSAGSASTALDNLTGIPGATLASSFSSSAGLNGTLESQVYTGANGLTLGGDTYVFTLFQNGAANDAVDQLSLSGFAGTTFSIYDINSGGISVVGSTYSTASGTLTITFQNALNRSQQYDQIVIYDSNSTYMKAAAEIFDSDGAAAVAFGPDPPATSPVPEASTLMAGALMLIPLGLSLIRKLQGQRAA